MCRKDCDRTEEVDNGTGVFELWCYCLKCDIESFHPIPIKYSFLNE